MPDVLSELLSERLPVVLIHIAEDNRDTMDWLEGCNTDRARGYDKPCGI